MHTKVFRGEGDDICNFFSNVKANGQNVNIQWVCIMDICIFVLFLKLFYKFEVIYKKLFVVLKTHSIMLRGQFSQSEL